MIATQPIVEQLIDIYLSEEWWHEKKLDRTEADKYFSRLLSTGNIITYSLNGELLGYVEVHRLTFEQWGRIVCHAQFSAYLEDVQHGPVAYVANTYIKPEYRRTNVYKILRLGFFKFTYNCEYFVGHALRKKTQPIKVLRRDKALKKYGGK